MSALFHQSSHTWTPYLSCQNIQILQTTHPSYGPHSKQGGVHSTWFRFTRSYVHAAEVWTTQTLWRPIQMHTFYWPPPLPGDTRFGKNKHYAPPALPSLALNTCSWIQWLQCVCDLVILAIVLSLICRFTLYSFTSQTLWHRAYEDPNNNRIMYHVCPMSYHAYPTIYHAYAPHITPILKHVLTVLLHIMPIIIYTMYIWHHAMHTYDISW